MRKWNYPDILKRVSLLATVALVLSGCTGSSILDPKGPVGAEQKYLIMTSFFLMLIVVIPVIVMTILFACRYNYVKNAKYSPNWSHSNKIEVVVWAVPLAIVFILSVLTWRSTHALDPHRVPESDRDPIVIQVMALDWKWLFVYPEQGIASVNELAFPVDTPVEFRVSSNSVMNSFFIPQLGSQIYAMAGMENTVHLMATEEGTYPGMSANYSGHGFSGMHFKALATSDEGFQQWVDSVRQSSETLQQDSFNELAKPSRDNPVEYFSTVTPGLYTDIVNSYITSGDSSHHGAEE